MGRNDDIQQQLLAVFQIELQEHVATLNQGLLKLEQGLEEDKMEALLAEVFRAAHSLKGAARGVGVIDVETLAHKVEDVLSAMRQGSLDPTPMIFDALFSLVDAFGEAMRAFMGEQRLSVARRDQLFETLDSAIKGEQQADHLSPESQIPSGSASALSYGPTEDTIRVSTTKLDSLMEDAGELLVAGMRSEQHLSELGALQSLLGSWQRDWRSVRSKFHQMERGNGSGSDDLLISNHQSGSLSDQSQVLLKFLKENESYLKSLQNKIDESTRLFAENHNRFSLLIDNMQGSVRQVRMLPIAALFDSFPRIVRDLARDQGKQVVLEIEGAETEVDRQILEAMKDPLNHLLRNAVDHGINSPSLRESAGKPAGGTIHLRAFQRGNSVILEVTDDGDGINLDAMRAAAVKGELLSPDEAHNLSDLAALDLIFTTGLSTQDVISEVSGRGVGLDVVRQNLDRIHGLITVETQRGVGTTFTLTLPLTMATSHVLLIAAAGQTVAAPTTAIERILRVDAGDIRFVEGKPAIEFNERPLPLIHLNQALQLPVQKNAMTDSQKIHIVVMGAAEKRVAFQVDELRETQEVVVRSLGAQLRRVPNIAGAAILGNGEVAMILNVSDLMKSTVSKANSSRLKFNEVSEQRRRRVLVVDDSITTRTLEKNILENAGFSVVVAANGQEAWGLVQFEALDVIVADVDMPRMDGIELTKTVKADARHQKTPVILVTSLESTQDKIKGMEAGADAYIVKSSFDQQDLLKTIERLIG